MIATVTLFDLGALVLSGWLSGILTAAAIFIWLVRREDKRND